MKRQSEVVDFMMKAAVLTDTQNLEIRKIPIPACPPNGVLVQVKACGICTADVKMVAEGHRALIYPRILGHEIAGVIAESRTDQYSPGERVQIAPGLRCGNCDPCGRNADHQCLKREIFGFTRDGGFTNFLAVPLQGPMRGALNRLPATVSAEEATLAEPIACCLNAQYKVAVKEGDSVLIVGAGTLGLLHLLIARLKGAGKIFVSEVHEYRRKMAREFGANEVFNPENVDLFQCIMDATHGSGVDIIIFACSQVGIENTFLRMSAPGGRISVFSGISNRFSNIRLDLNFIHYHELTITGAYGCTAAQNAEAIGWLASGKLPIKRFITQRVGLEEVAAGLEYTAGKKGLKSIIKVQYE
ncbi:MAG: alcohol dehydrogenase catalytic domain-containing protein [Desulfobacterales bacterium]|nr:alcohol dehydrogenase catalytic domain-containing protein [Desulfobacterales bacterium]